MWRWVKIYLFSRLLVRRWCTSAPSCGCWSTGSRGSARSEPSTSVWKRSWNKPNSTWCWSRTSGPASVSWPHLGLERKDVISGQLSRFLERVFPFKELFQGHLEPWLLKRPTWPGWLSTFTETSSIISVLVEVPHYNSFYSVLKQAVWHFFSVCPIISWAAAGLRGGLPGVLGGTRDGDGQAGDESELLQSPPHDDHLLRRVLETSIDGRAGGRTGRRAAGLN